MTAIRRTALTLALPVAVVIGSQLPGSHLARTRSPVSTSRSPQPPSPRRATSPASLDLRPDLGDHGGHLAAEPTPRGSRAT